MEELGRPADARASYEVRVPEPGTTILTVAGELDLSNVDALAAAVTPIVERNGDRLVVQAGDLRFADSSAIALLLRWAAVTTSIEVRDVPPLLRAVIDSLGLTATLGAG